MTSIRNCALAVLLSVPMAWAQGIYQGAGGGGGGISNITFTAPLTGGTISSSGQTVGVVLSAVNAQTGTYQVLASDFTNYKTITVASGTFTITLVASGSQPAAGQYIQIVNYGSGVVTIARSGQNINGGTSSLTLGASSATAPQSTTVISDGTNYFATGIAGNGGVASVQFDANPALTGAIQYTSGAGMQTSQSGNTVTVSTNSATNSVQGTLVLGTDLGGTATAPNVVGGTHFTTAGIFTPAARTSGVASYFTINIPTDTGITAATESIGNQTVTATRTWATTGTVALQRENFFAGPTYASASASQTFTDAFTLYSTPPVAGTNAIFTRGHTLGIVDATSAASSITGAVVVAATLGTAGTSVGIGGGNVNAGGSVTAAQLVNTTTPVRDQTRFVLVSNMTAVSTAGVNIGSTGASNVTFSWPVTSANWYDMECKLPVTFVSSATIKFQLVSISGSVTISEVNAETLGNTGASAAFQDLATIAGTTLAGSATPTTGAPGGVSEQITYSSQFLTSHAGNIGLEFIGNGANNVQMLLGGECGLTQIN